MVSLLVSHLILECEPGSGLWVGPCVSQIKKLWLRRGLWLSKVAEFVSNKARIRTAINPVLFLNCLLVSFLLP